MQDYTVSIEIDRAEPTEDVVDALMDHLANFAPTVGMSPRGWVQVQLTIPAHSIAMAGSIAEALVVQYAAAKLVSLEVATTAEWENREGQDRVPPLIGVADAAELLKVSPQRVRQMIDEHKIAAHRFGERGIVLVRSEIEAKLENAS